MEPCATARVNVEYPTAIWTHCGVGWVYFAGRYWVIDPPQPGGGEQLFGVSSLPPGERELYFTAEDGRRFAFNRAESGFTPPWCY